MEPKAPGALCENCSLNACVAVMGDGPPKAKVVVVGEAPGVQEHKLGKPFVGPSGKLLKKVLEHHGYDLNDVYLTNSVLCHPPGNRKPTAKESRLCRDRLVQEVLSHEPEVIIAFGNSAAQSILETRTGISQLRRGGAKQAAFTCAPVVCTYHPAAALRNQALFPDILFDIGQLAKGHVKVGFEPGTYVTVGAGDADRYLHELESCKVLAADIETTGLYAKRDDVITLGISHRPGAALSFTEEAYNTSKDRLHRLFGDRAITWIWQNGKFDIQFLREDGIAARVDEDTLLRHYTLDERTAGVHDLGQLATQYCNAPDYKEASDKYKKNMRLMPLDELHHYVAMDTDMTFRVHLELKKDFINDAELTGLYYGLLIPGSECLTQIEQDGVAVDEPHIDALRIAYQEELDGLEQVLLDKWGLLNPRSPQQVSRCMTEMGVKNLQSTDEKTLTQLRKNRKYTDFCDTLLEHRGFTKLVGTYLNGLQKRLYAGRLFSTFLLHGTETGRLSSRNPNLQNIPRESTIRSIFVPAEGHSFVQGDYSQAELRVLAVLSGDPTLQQIFRDRRSLHKEVAVRFYGADYSEDQYVRAKAVNFGIPYGREAGSIAQEFSFSFREAQRIIDEWFALYPVAAGWLNEKAEEALRLGDLVSPFGRHRRFNLITNENKHGIRNEARAFNEQSTASDLNLVSAIKVQPLLPVGSSIQILIHDAILLEVPDEDVEDVARLVKETMQTVGVEKFDFPFDAEIKIGKSWGELHG